MSRTAYSAVAVLFVSLFAVTATAQNGLRDRDPNLAVTRKISSELQSAGLHWGSFYLISRLQLQDIGYDTHFYIPSNSPELKIAVNAPQRLYFVPTRKIVASAEVAPSLALLRKGKRQIGFTSRADLQFIFNHIWLDFYTSILDDLRPKTGEVNSVLTAREREFGLNGEFKYSSRTDMTFSATTRTTSYPLTRFQPQALRDVLPLLDRDEESFRGTFKHNTFPLTRITLAAELSEYQFRTTPHRDSRRSYLGAGANFDNGPTVIYGEIVRGKLDFFQPGQRDYSGLLGNITASRRVNARTFLTVNAVRDIDFSVFIANNYFISDRYGLTVNYDATRRLKLRGMAQYGRDSYDTPVDGLKREDTLSWTGVGWNYARRHIQGGFDIGYYRRTTNLPSPMNDEGKGIRILYHLSLNL